MSSHNTAVDQLARLKQSDVYLDRLTICFSQIENGTSHHFPHWRESIFNFQVFQWVKSLQKKSSLEQAIVHLDVADSTLWDERKTKSIMNAIGALPALKKLVLHQSRFGGPPHMATLSAIRSAIDNTRCLKHLEIWGLEIVEGAEEDLQALARAIQRLKQLKTFKIWRFKMNEIQIRALLPVFQNPSISELCLGDTSDGYLPIMDLLASNQTLVSLTLGVDRHLDDSVCEKLAEVLESNHHLRFLSLSNFHLRHQSIGFHLRDQSSGISEKGQKALTRLMERNHFIHELKTTGQPNADIAFYAKLNRAGRRLLFMNSTTKSQWVDVLSALEGDVECLFYVLQMNPSMCDSGVS